MGEILRDGGASFWDAGEFSILCTDEAGAVVVAMTARRLGGADAAERLKLVD